jgi:histidyl-tRNA synthetase
MGVNVALGSNAKLDKQIKSAHKKGIHYVLFIGEKELDEEQYTLRNLLTGVEERHGASRIVSIIKDYRSVED